MSRLEEVKEDTIIFLLGYLTTSQWYSALNDNQLSESELDIISDLMESAYGINIKNEIEEEYGE